MIIAAHNRPQGPMTYPIEVQRHRSHTIPRPPQAEGPITPPVCRADLTVANSPTAEEAVGSSGQESLQSTTSAHKNTNLPELLVYEPTGQTPLVPRGSHQVTTPGVRPVGVRATVYLHQSDIQWPTRPDLREPSLVRDLESPHLALQTPLCSLLLQRKRKTTTPITTRYFNRVRPIFYILQDVSVGSTTSWTLPLIVDLVVNRKRRRMTRTTRRSTPPVLLVSVDEFLRSPRYHRRV